MGIGIGEEEMTDQLISKKFKIYWHPYLSKRDRWKAHPSSVVLDAFEAGWNARHWFEVEEVKKRIDKELGRKK